MSEFFKDGGEVGRLMAARDWSGTALGGEPQCWPTSLKTLLGVILRSPVPMVVLWGDEGIMMYNDAYSLHLGARHPGLLGANVRESWPEAADFNDHVIRRGLAGNTFSFRDEEFKLLEQRRRELVYRNLDYSPVPGDDGNPAGVLGVLSQSGYEVAERVRADGRREALLKLDELLHKIVDPADLAFASAEMLGKALDACRVGYGDINSEAGTITVGKTWSLPGMPDTSGVHEFANYGTYIEELRAGRSVRVSDVEFDPRTSAQAAAFRAIGIRSCLDAPVMETGSAVAEVFVHSAVPRVWTNEEVSLACEFAERTRAQVARRKAESSLQKSESRYRTLFDSIDQGFCIVEFVDGPEGPLSDYVHLEANPAYERHAGISSIVGKTGRGELTATEAEAWIGLFRRVLLTGEPIRFERELAATARHLEVACVRVEPAERRQLAILFQDVTARKRAEQALLEMNETLEQRVTERTTDLMRAEEALRQAQKMEAVGQLTGGIAHDFNNLLVGITGSLELLQRRVSAGRSDEIDRFVTTAITSAQRAAALTQRLLAFARRQPLDPKRVNANLLVAGMEDLLRRSLGPSVELEMSLSAGLWSTLCDPNQLENGILNLAINARDAMPEGGRLTVETSNSYLDEADGRAMGAELEPGQYICISVTDTGAGLTPDIIAKAFDPFFTTKPLGQGTGLGLSMLYGFVKQSGGHIRIHSEPDRGTTVKIHLPRLCTAVEESDNSTTVNDYLGSQGAEAGETVLVLDDEASVRMLVTETLEDLGYAALEAADSRAALRILETEARVDLLITDVGLPGLNGRQIADAARTLRPQLKVLFMTGYAYNAAIGNQTLQPGMKIITKPFALDALAKTIRDMIEANYSSTEGS